MIVELPLHSRDGRNRLDLATLAELAAAPQRFPAATAFVVSGNRRHFSVGADLGAIAALEAAGAWEMARAGQRSLQAIATSRVPYIAAVAGYCLGGGFDLALACQARVATPEAYFGHHGAKLGLVTGWGGTQRLPRLIGAGQTLLHLLAAQGWTGAEAAACGLVAELAPPGELAAAAERVAREFAKLEPVWTCC